jgi:hypothetical protein
MKKITSLVVALLLMTGINISANADYKGKKGKDKHNYSHKHHQKGHFMKIFDKDGDKKLSVEEMKAHALIRFNENDLNKDGVITIDEINSKIDTEFIASDLDKDGSLSKEELRKGFKRKFMKQD